MKTASVLAAAAGLGLASAALAQPVDLNVGAINGLVPGQPQVFNFNVPQSFDVTGFSFMGDLVQIGPAGAWGSDMRMVIMAPGGASVSIGGFDTLSDLDWDFSGSGSASPGSYASGPHAWALGNSTGAWSLTFTNDWASGNGSMDWSNVKVTLVPAPGVAALMGLGGLVALRRRR